MGSMMKHEATSFQLRCSIERLREGLFDPFAVKLLTVDEQRLFRTFSKGLEFIIKKKSDYLCIRGSYGQGKSHSLSFLKNLALSQGYAVSMLSLDLRELPFHQFALIYQEVMTRLQLPDEKSLSQKWKEWARKQVNHDGEVLNSLPVTMPFRFKKVLLALLNKNLKLSDKQKSLKKFKDFKPREYNYWLERALMGRPISLLQLKNAFKYRQVPLHKGETLKCRGNEPYFLMLQSLSLLLQKMGYKGLVLLFDECESIAQLRLEQRKKSYELLESFFRESSFSGIYSVFAFTDDFFDKLHAEPYDKVRIKGDQEFPIFAKNFSIEWQDLKEYRLQDFSKKDWQNLQKRLIQIYAEAYRTGPISLEIQDKVKSVLERLEGLETRHKIKAMVYQLDIETQDLL
jgi:hypothetical protein